MKLRAIVPVQHFARAKSRLSPVLDEDARADLAEALATHVTDVLRAHDAISEVLIVTPSPTVRAWAAARGLACMLDAPHARGLAAVVDAACTATPTVVVMSDLPGLVAADIDALVTEAAHVDVLIAPDTANQGTNALFMRTPFATCFGHADSAARHEARARELGLRVARLHRAGLQQDLDQPADVSDLAERFSPRSG